MLRSAPGTGIKPAGTATWPAARRLLRRPEFRAVYEQGMRRSSPHFTVFGLPPAAPGGVTRFGITVTRKQGGSVVRNRIRRRTREILRRCSLELGGGAAIVINPRTSVAEAEFTALAAELTEQVRLLAAALARKAARDSGGAA